MQRQRRGFAAGVWGRVLAALVVLAAGCAQDDTVETDTESMQQLCTGEWRLMTWTGTELTQAAFGAIDQFEAGEVEAAQVMYDSTARIMDALPVLLAAYTERCQDHTPERVAETNDAVELANARWEELQRGCRAGPALQGFRCG